MLNEPRQHNDGHNGGLYPTKSDSWRLEKWLIALTTLHFTFGFVSLTVVLDPLLQDNELLLLWFGALLLPLGLYLLRRCDTARKHLGGAETTGLVFFMCGAALLYFFLERLGSLLGGTAWPWLLVPLVPVGFLLAQFSYATRDPITRWGLWLAGVWTFVLGACSLALFTLSLAASMAYGMIFGPTDRIMISFSVFWVLFASYLVAALMVGAAYSRIQSEARRRHSATVA
jgi:hypothetical protein